MKELFDNGCDAYICFSDDGIEFKHGSTHRFYPYGSMAILKYTFWGVNIVGRGASENKGTFITNKNTNTKRIKQLLKEAIKRNNAAEPCEPYNIDKNGNKKELPTQEELEKQIAENKEKHKQEKEEFNNKEFRKRCNVCGTVFCYTYQDIKNNIKSGIIGGLAGFGAATNAVGGSAYNSYELNKMGDRSNAKVMDFEHCPNCHSKDLKLLSDEEYEKIKQEGNTPTTNTVSAADELKKFKELLDMGAITQEEFDAKKKQLLGL